MTLVVNLFSFLRFYPQHRHQHLIYLFSIINIIIIQSNLIVIEINLFMMIDNVSKAIDLFIDLISFSVTGN